MALAYCQLILVAILLTFLMFFEENFSLIPIVQCRPNNLIGFLINIFGHYVTFGGKSGQIIGINLFHFVPFQDLNDIF